MTVRSIPIKKTMYPNVLRDLLDMRYLLSAYAHFFRIGLQSKGEITTEDGKNTAGRGDTVWRKVLRGSKGNPIKASSRGKRDPEDYMVGVFTMV